MTIRFITNSEHLLGVPELQLRRMTPEIEIRLAKDEGELEKLDAHYGPGEYRKKRKRT
jgi:hypothetical protein